MATVTKPIALDESINTTESTPRNVADVLAQELANIASAIGGGGGSGGHTIDLHGYTSGSPYVTEHDGFAYIAPQANNEFLWIKGFSAMGGLSSQLNTTFVKKGMELYTNAGSSSTVRFTETV